MFLSEEVTSEESPEGGDGVAYVGHPDPGNSQGKELRQECDKRVLQEQPEPLWLHRLARTSHVESWDWRG